MITDTTEAIRAEKRTRTFGGTMRRAESWFGKAAYPLVFIAPNNFICLFAGASGMGQWRTYLLWRNAESFGTDDAQFGKDIGYGLWLVPASLVIAPTRPNSRCFSEDLVWTRIVRFSA